MSKPIPTTISIYQIDAFASGPFRGNPAAVCFPDRERPATWMQAVAAEMNLSETAFLQPAGDGYGLRWFTPSVEVDLCGHATLASAHILWETGRLAGGVAARFYTRSGLLTCVPRGEWIEMHFPSKPEEKADEPAGLADALGVNPVYVGRNQFDYLVQIDSPAALRGMNPDHRMLKTLDVRGVIVTSPSDSPEFDFLSRFFAPGSGIDEDPATGSAHCCLAPFWSERLGKAEMTGFQASARAGIVRVRVAGDRVVLCGQAVTVFTGELTSAASEATG